MTRRKARKPREFLVVDTGSLLLTCKYGELGKRAANIAMMALVVRHGARNVIHVREVLPKRKKRK
jgi:hypothetical protein